MPCVYCLEHVRRKGVVESRATVLARRLGKGNPVKGVVGFDVDGVLEGYGGIISRGVLDSLKGAWFVGIISGRGDHTRIKDEFGLDFSYQWDGGALDEAKRRFEGASRFVYVSDNLERKSVCDGAGWKFYTPTAFLESLGRDVSNSVFPFQVSVFRLCLVVTLIVANALDYYTTKKGLEVGLKEKNVFARTIMKMGWRKYQAFKFIPVSLYAYQALTSEDPYFIWTASLAVASAMFTYAAIQNWMLIMGKR